MSHTYLTRIYKASRELLSADTLRRVERVWPHLVRMEALTEGSILQERWESAYNTAHRLWTLSPHDGAELTTMCTALKKQGHPDAETVELMRSSAEQRGCELMLVPMTAIALEAHEAETAVHPEDYTEKVVDDGRRQRLAQLLTEEGYEADLLTVLPPAGSCLLADEVIVLYAAPSAAEAYSACARLQSVLPLCGIRVIAASSNRRIPGAGEHPVAVLI